MQNKNVLKIISILISVTLIFVLSCSLIYIVKETNHDCDGDNCLICFNIKQCEENIRIKTGGTINFPIMTLIILAVLFCLILKENDIFPKTLITQKVRLND